MRLSSCSVRPDARTRAHRLWRHGSLAAQGEAGLAKLSGLQGKTFEIAYANAMVSGHEAGLNLLDKQLIPAAKTAEVKQFLTDTRDVVAQHLEHAKKMQASL